MLRSQARRWASERQTVLVAFLASRAIVILTTYLSAWARGLAPRDQPWITPLSRLAMWDVGHYVQLAAAGYRTSSPAELDQFVFFPLWPALIRAAHLILPLNLTWSAILLANICAFAAILSLRRLLAREASPDLADRACTYLLLFPTSYALSMGYADSLFLLLAVLYFDSMRRDRRSWALLAGFCAGLARPLALFLPAAALLDTALAARRARLASRLVLPRIVRGLTTTAAPALGIAAYCWMSYRLAGDPLLPFRRQWRPGWKDQPSFFLTTALDKLGNAGKYALAPDVWLAFLALAAFLLALYSFTTLPTPYAAYSAVAILLGMSTKNFASTDRYLLSLFPLFWTLAHLGRHRPFDLAFRTTSPVLLGALSLLVWTNHYLP